MSSSVVPGRRLRQFAIRSVCVAGLGTIMAAGVPRPVHALDAASQSAQPASPGGTDLLDLSLEDLLDLKVYAASKVVQDVAQAPASVTIVAADEIRRHGYRTLADILRGVRGFYVTSDRNYSYVGVRGFQRPGDYNGRVLLMVNGHRLNDTIFEQALIGTESPIDVNVIDRVEVIRGPSSSLYGTSAFFAVVNVITRAGGSVDGTEVEVEGGSQTLARGRVVAGGKTARGLEGLIAVSGFATSGNDRIHFAEFDDDAGPGLAVDMDRDRAHSLFASASAGDLSLQVGFNSRTKRIPTAAFDTLFNDARAQTTDRRGFADLQYSRRLDPRTSIEVRGEYDRYTYDGAYPYDTGVLADDANGDWLTGEALFTRQVSAHAVTVGTEYRYNLRQNQSAHDETGVLLDDHRRSQTAALFVEDQYRVNARLLLNAGLRWDQYFGLFGSTINPRFAVIVTPYRSGTLKLLYGRAFRAPNPFELYYDQNALSAQLQPERINTAELTWDQRVLPRLQASASVFRSGVADLIVQSDGSDETIDGLYFRNGDNVTASGVELELQGELPGRARARLAQVFQSATRDTTGRPISNSPARLSTLVVDAPVPGTDAIVAFDGYYVGERRGMTGGIVKGAFLANLSLSRRSAARRLGVGLTIYNIFNGAYGDPGSLEHREAVIPQDGRTGAVRVSWRF
jgi:iron complex outermembrane receptor protein